MERDPTAPPSMYRIRCKRDDGAELLFANDVHGVDWIAFTSREVAQRKADALSRIYGGAHPDGRGDGAPFYTYTVEEVSLG